MEDRKLAAYCVPHGVNDDYFVEHSIVGQERRDVWKKEFLVSFVKEIENLGPDIHTVVFSSEHFHSRLRSEEGIVNLRAVLGERFRKCELIVYFRRQDELAVSLYTTAMRVGYYDRPIFPDVTPANTYFNYNRSLEMWAKIFGRDTITARIFDPAHLIESSLIVDFLTCFGLYYLNKDVTLVEPENVSLSDLTLGYLNEFNRRIRIRTGHNRQLITILRNILTKRVESRSDGQKLLPSRSSAMKFYRQFETDNRMLFDRWFSGNSFSHDFSKYPESLFTIKVSAEQLLDELSAILRDEPIVNTGKRPPVRDNCISIPCEGCVGDD